MGASVVQPGPPSPPSEVHLGRLPPLCQPQCGHHYNGKITFSPKALSWGFTLILQGCLSGDSCEVSGPRRAPPASLL